MMVAAIDFRNRKITSTTSAIDSISVNWTSWTASRIGIERSFSTFRPMDAGSCSR